jgi:hypothetical protein
MHEKFRIVRSWIFVQRGSFTKVNITFEVIRNYSPIRYSVSGLNEQTRRAIRSYSTIRNIRSSIR